ncbi:MAG: pyrroline-5-carboxylate reductase [Oscillospiraceae bacterium]
MREIGYSKRELKEKELDALYDLNLGIIGAGNMASAILKGVIGKGLFAQIMVSAKTEESLKPWEEAGLIVTTDNKQVMMESEVIILAVKPQSINEIMEEIGSYASGKCIVSIAAGITRRHLRHGLGEEAFLIRAMPNLSLSVGKGATAVTYGYGVPDPLYKAVLAAFEASGEVVLMHDKQLNDIMALNGSSPAYFFRMARAMMDWAKERGIDAEAALRLVGKSMEGAAAMLLSGEHTAAELTDQVCSKGGTTLAALSAFDEMKFDEMMAEAMTRCAKRGEELSEELCDTPADVSPGEILLMEQMSRRGAPPKSPLDSLILPGK